MVQNIIALICGDTVFPEAKWNNYKKDDNDKKADLDLFKNKLYQQAVDLSTLVSKTSGDGIIQSISLLACSDGKFTKYFNYVVHKSIKDLVKCPNLGEIERNLFNREKISAASEELYI